MLDVFYGKMGRLIKDTIKKVAPIGEPGKQAFNNEHKSFFHNLSSFTKSQPADEDLDTSGGSNHFNRQNARRAYRNYKSLMGQDNIGDVLCDAPPQLVTPDLRTMMDTFNSKQSPTMDTNKSKKDKAPKTKQWNIMTLNVENLKSLGKHFLIIQIMIKFDIDILCMQETHYRA